MKKQTITVRSGTPPAHQTSGARRVRGPPGRGADQGRGRRGAGAYWGGGGRRRSPGGPAAAGPGEDFLSSCFTCTKKLEWNDIYIYRYAQSFSLKKDTPIITPERTVYPTNNCGICSPMSIPYSFGEQIL